MLYERATVISGTADTPVFPSPLGNLRDASNTAADLRDAFDNAGFGWATSHVLRKTTASVLDAAGLAGLRPMPERMSQLVTLRGAPVGGI
jgi:hypothetical protein